MLTGFMVIGEDEMVWSSPGDVTGNAGVIIHFGHSDDGRDLETAATEFDRHFTSLPSLDELEQKLRSMDPSFDNNVERATRDRYRELLADVDSGQISRLAAERVRLGLTQCELSERSGIPQANISRMETPGHEMKISSARKLAAALEIDDYRILLP